MHPAAPRLPLHLTDRLVVDWSRRFRRTRDLETVGAAKGQGHKRTKSFQMIQVLLFENN